MAPSASNPWPVRLLMMAAVMGLLVLLGLAVSTESRQEFESSPMDGDADQGSNEIGDGDHDNRSDFDGTDGHGAKLGESGDATDGTSAVELISLDIRSDQGSVGIRLEEGGVVAIPRSGDGARGEQDTLQPNTDGDDSGLRLSDDGRLEPVSACDIQPGDLVIRPAENGLDIVRSDGGHTAIRGDSLHADSTIGFTVVEVAADGTASPLTPNDDGQIDLGDGVSIQLPDGGQTLTLWERATTTPWRWIVLAIVALALTSIAVALYLHHNRPMEPFGRDFVGRGGVPADRFEDFLAMLQTDPDPARAIRLAFSAAERGMGSLPARHATETPFEWSSRVRADQPHLEVPLTSLCSRFATARFAPERPTLSDRDEAIVELRQLAQQASFAPTQHGSVTSEGVGIGG